MSTNPPNPPTDETRPDAAGAEAAPPKGVRPATDEDPGTLVLGDGTASAWSRPWRLLVFALWYAGALVTSSGAVVRDLVTPGNQARSGIARIRLNCRTDVEVTMLSSLITLTPGTLTMGTNRTAGASDPDGARLLYVHGLYADDAPALREEIHDMERRMLHAVRRNGVR